MTEIRLIDANALKKVILNLPNDNPSYYYTGDLLDREGVLDEIDNAPTIKDRSLEIAQKSIELGRKVGQLEGKLERPHGKWTTEQGTLLIKCSVCNQGYYYHPKNHFYHNFCPNCGADMRGEE